MIAAFAQAVRPEARVVPDAARAELAALTTRRRQLIAMQTGERQRLTRVRERGVVRRIAVHIRWMGKEIADLEHRLQQAIGQHPLWRRLAALLQSVDRECLLTIRLAGALRTNQGPSDGGPIRKEHGEGPDGSPHGDRYRGRLYRSDRYR